MSVVQRLWRLWAPPWFTPRHISTFYDSVGALLDGEAQRVLDGRLASNPYAGAEPNAAKLATGLRIECEPDALPYHASDRGIPLFVSLVTWGARVNLSRFRQLWADKGTHRGRMRMVQAYFYGPQGQGPLPTIHEVHECGLPTEKVATWHRLSGGVPGADGTSEYTRTMVTGPSNFNFDNNGVDSAEPIAPEWLHGTDYEVGDERTNDGQKLYVCITAGTSALVGSGPTGTGSNITDGTVHWRYAQANSRWWTFIDMSTLVTAGTFTAPPTYGNGFNYGQGNLYGGGSGGTAMGAQEHADLVAMHNWKGAASSLWGVALDWHGVIDPAGTPTQDADGRWSLPNGKWGRLVDPSTGLATRPAGVQWLYDRSQP